MKIVFIMVLTALFNGEPDMHMEVFATEAECQAKVEMYKEFIQGNVEQGADIKDFKGACSEVKVALPK